MSALIAQLLIVLGLIGTLIALYRISHHREAATCRACARRLAELDRLPEFELAPPDWPIRESPPRELERAR